jgi:putative salt-induced outer membrane protein
VTPAAPATAAPPPATPAPQRAPASAPAAAAPPPLPPRVWKATGSAGFVQAITAGNKTADFNAKFHLETVRGNWAHEFNFDALTTHDDHSGANTERYIAGTKSKMAETHLDYAFIQSEWQKDRSSPFSYQAFLSSGFGHYFVKTSTMQFNLELGAGVRHSEPGDPAIVEVNPPTTENDAILNFNGNFHWQIKPDMSFNQKLELQDGHTNLVAHSVTELKQNISKTLAFGLSYDYSHDSTGTGTTDSISTINLIYQFP